MATRREIVEGQLGTTAVELYSVPANLVGVGPRIFLTNTDTSTDISVNVWVAQDGSAASTDNLRVNTQILTAGEDRAFSLPSNLAQGGKVYGSAGAATTINYDFSVTLIPQSNVALK